MTNIILINWWHTRHDNIFLNNVVRSSVTCEIHYYGFGIWTGKLNQKLIHITSKDPGVLFNKLSLQSPRKKYSIESQKTVATKTKINITVNTFITLMLKWEWLEKIGVLPYRIVNVSLNTYGISYYVYQDQKLFSNLSEEIWVLKK